MKSQLQQISYLLKIMKKIATERCPPYRPSFESSQSKIYGQEAKIIQKIQIQSHHGQFLQSGMVQLMYHIPLLAFGQKTGPSDLLLAKQYFISKQQRPPNIKPKLLSKHPNPKNIEKINRLFPNEENLIPIYYYRFTKGYIFKNEREKYLFYQKIKDEIGLNENLSQRESFLKIQFIPLITNTNETNTQDQIKQYVVKISFQYRKKNIIKDETVQNSGQKEKLKYTLIYQNKPDQKQWKNSTKLLHLKQKKIYTKQLNLMTKLDKYLFFSHQQSKENQMKMFQILDEHFKNLKIPDMKRFRVSKILRIQQKQPQRLEKIIQQIIQKIPVERPIYGYKKCQNSDINYYFDFKNQQEAASAAVYVWMKNTNFQFVNKEEVQQKIKWEQLNIFEQATIQRFNTENYSQQ